MVNVVDLVKTVLGVVDNVIDFTGLVELPSYTSNEDTSKGKKKL